MFQVSVAVALEKNIIQKGSISLDVEHIKEPVPNKRQDVEFIRVSMQDNAGGFDEALMETLFEPYVTTKVKGTGLGLSIVRKLVEEHLGVIELSKSVTKRKKKPFNCHWNIKNIKSSFNA